VKKRVYTFMKFAPQTNMWSFPFISSIANGLKKCSLNNFLSPKHMTSLCKLQIYWNWFEAEEHFAANAGNDPIGSGIE